VLERLTVSSTVQVPNKEGVIQVRAKDRYRVGDTYTMRRRDELTKITIQETTFRVTQVTDEKVMINDDVVLTREGGTISNQFIRKMDPPRLDLPSDDYAIGKKWTFRSLQSNFNGSKMWVEGQVRVVALEAVTVPAGTFMAYRLELNSISDSGTRVKLTRWMQPELGYPVKLLREIRNRGQRDVPTLEYWELIAHRRGPA
jgi:hypothetical protein